jgi:hypothetical protein
MAIYKIQASRVNNIESTEFVGQSNELGQIWYDPIDGILRLYDGNAGGKIINGGGTANASQLVNGNSNVVVYPNGNVAISVNGTSNVMVFSNPNAFTGNVVASGNVSAGNVLSNNYFYANGEPFSGGANYTNANVANFLADLGSNAISTTANISADYFIGNGSLLTGINSNYSNANVAAYLPTNTSDIGASNITAAGSITADAVSASVLSGTLSSASQPNITGLGTLTGLNIDGNITGDLLPSANVTYDLGSATQAWRSLYISGNTLYIANEQMAVDSASGLWSFTSAGDQINLGIDSVFANSISANYVLGNGAFLTGVVTDYGNANVADFLADLGANAVSTAGNVTAGYFVGNGALLSGITTNYSNANVEAYLPTYTGNLNPDTVTATGNITATYFVGNGALLSGISGTYSNANVEAYLPTYTGNLVPDTIVATGNITGNYFVGNGSLLTGITTDYSNANVAAYLPINTSDVGAANITATGNITGNYFIGNGALLSGITANYSNANVVSLLSDLGSNNISTAGNIAADFYTGNGSLLTGIVATEIGNLSTLTVSGNVLAGNVQSLGEISAVGNVAATYFLGNGAFLTGITAGNGVPSQTGQAGKFLTTDGTTASWNDALGASLTFNGGASYADQATELEGGTAASAADNAVDGGGAASDFSLTLSPVALTGQYEDLVDLDVSIPAEPTSAGAKGQIAFDTDFIYLCVAPNTWRRATLASWS